MSTIDEHGRPEPRQHAPEIETLTGFLDYLRATLEWKCRGLDADALHARPLPTGMSLGGLLKHLAYVEDHWFGCVIAGRTPSAPWADVDWGADPDWDWHSSDADTPEEIHGLWQSAVEASRRHWGAAQAASSSPLEESHPVPKWGENVSARWVLTHMIEEYARHCGHADLLREAIDGQTGE